MVVGKSFPLSEPQVLFFFCKEDGDICIKKSSFGDILRTIVDYTASML